MDEFMSLNNFASYSVSLSSSPVPSLPLDM